MEGCELDTVSIDLSDVEVGLYFFDVLWWYSVGYAVNAIWLDIGRDLDCENP